MSWVLVRYVLRGAVRDKILIVLLAALLVGTSLAVLMGSATIVESGQTAAAFAGSGLRMIGVLGLVLFVVFHVRRSFESKDVEFLLSRPVSRGQFLLSFAVAFSFLALLTALAEGICLSAIMPKFFDPGVVLWIASIAVENIIMVNAALFFSMFLSSAASGAMATMGLYVLARMMGELLGIVDMGGTGVTGSHILASIIQVISTVTPRLDLMGQTSWLVYGTDGTVGYVFLCLQAVIFTALILTAAMIDLVRRKF